MNMQYWTLTPPAQWKAGTVGSGDTARDFYFDCGDCGAKEPKIAGILSSDGTFTGIGVLPGKDGSPFVRTAMFCESCFTKRVAK
jgi:hypothetical protein